MRSVLDFRPVNFEVVAKSGAEPSLRDLIYQHYARQFEDQKACELARDYCSQIESFLKETRQ